MPVNPLTAVAFNVSALTQTLTSENIFWQISVTTIG